jgi:hypothetical protein
MALLRYDGTTTVWKQVRDGDGATVDIDPTDTQIQYSVFQYASSLARSSNGGATWSGFGDGLPSGTVCQTMPFEIHPRQPDIVIASCQKSLWQRTFGQASNWQPILTLASGAVTSGAIDGATNLYYAGTNVGEIHAGPNGMNFSPVFSNPSSLRVTDMEVDPDRPEILYALLR